MSGSGVPVHTPLWQVSPVVQVLLSLHAVPSGWKASAGQVLDEPSQLSATSQSFAAGRQTAVLFASAGQLLLTPSQVSVRSHGPAEARHTAVLLASAGQARRGPAHDRARQEAVGWAVVAHAVAALGCVADVGDRTALGRALDVGRTGRVRARAGLGHVAGARRRATGGPGRQQRVRRA